jgi:hypothetical protein
MKLKCMCEWPSDGGGSGVLYCEGCGGDLCVCECGGEEPCDGCEYCLDTEYDDDWDDGLEVKAAPVRGEA